MRVLRINVSPTLNLTTFPLPSHTITSNRLTRARDLTAYQTYLSGPPGGRTLPLGNYRLSDLAGGAFGRGASSASTGMAARRAAIKASGTVNGGANYDDVLQYYTVSQPLESRQWNTV